MTTFVVIKPSRSYYQPLHPHASGHPQGCNPQPLSLTWLALALALAITGLLLAVLLTTIGLATPTNALNLALLPSAGGLAIALIMFGLELQPRLAWEGAWP